MAKLWKKGRGKLGPFQPLIGDWVATAETPMGPVTVSRSLKPILGDNYLELKVRWEFGSSSSGKSYEEVAIIGVTDDKQVGFWSFTSDGKRSTGTIADVTDLHPEAVGFEAQMPAGLARMVTGPRKTAALAGWSSPRTPRGGSGFSITIIERPGESGA